MTRYEQFNIAYLECAAWADAPEGETHLDFSSEAKMEAEKDCKAFLDSPRCHELIGDNATQAGHDFWLTRNGHGAGFFDSDRPWGKINGETLTKESKKFPEINVYVEGGKLYFE